MPDNIATEASDHGLTPEDYVQRLINTSRLDKRESRPPLSQEQIQAFFRDITQFSAMIPDYSNVKFDREFIYDDHD